MLNGYFPTIMIFFAIKSLLEPVPFKAMLLPPIAVFVSNLFHSYNSTFPSENLKFE